MALICAAAAVPSPELSESEESPASPRECLSAALTLASAKACCALAVAAGLETGAATNGMGVEFRPPASWAALTAAGVVAASADDDGESVPRTAPGAVTTPVAAAESAAAAAVCAAASAFADALVLTDAAVADAAVALPVPAFGVDVAALSAAVAAAPVTACGTGAPLVAPMLLGTWRPAVAAAACVAPAP